MGQSNLESSSRSWHLYFSPCGVEPVAGFVIKTCPPACGEAICMRQLAYQMAGYLLEGGVIEEEKAEVVAGLRRRFGQAAVSTDGNKFILDEVSLGTEVDKVAERAGRTVEGIRECMRKVDADPVTYYEKAAPEMREALMEVRAMSERAGNFGGTLAAAVVLAGEMREKLGRALDLGADDLGVIVRQALAFGLADRILEIDSTGLIFVGDVQQLRPKSGRR